MKNSKKVLQNLKKTKQVKKIATRRNFEPLQARWKQSGNLIFLKVTQVENSFEMWEEAR